MTGPEHYAKAEELLAREYPIGLREEPNARLARMTQAQAHATLALAAAAAMTGYGTGMPAADRDSWDKVCGVPQDSIPDEPL